LDGEGSVFAKDSGIASMSAGKSCITHLLSDSNQFTAVVDQRLSDSNKA
jgi:hypothetical protein